MKCAIEVPAFLLIVEIQVGHQNLKGFNRKCKREENDELPRNSIQKMLRVEEQKCRLLGIPDRLEWHLHPWMLIQFL